MLAVWLDKLLASIVPIPVMKFLLTGTKIWISPIATSCGKLFLPAVLT